jgi:oxygen-independent coproporphyrinogen-3 oxidase
VTHADHIGWLEALPAAQPVSLYFHIPFCDSLCWFCGCHMRVVNQYAPVQAYVDVLLAELSSVGRLLGQGRTVSHIHFGGGSPTILSPGDIHRLNEAVRERFTVLADAEIAVEVDPRGLTDEQIAAWAAAGVTRASIGMQDVNPRVQKAINRYQPHDVSKSATERLRAAGITSLNLDLMYGLPFQGVDDMRHTVEKALELRPDRLAVFGYAHVPEMKKHQRLIPMEALPGPDVRFAQYEAAHQVLVDAGYAAIGLDHYGVPDDALVRSQTSGRLSRNFQGYTTDGAEALVGLGASAISSLPQGYVQNLTETPHYRDAVNQGLMPTGRGRRLTQDDRIRRAVIERLMCDLEVDADAVALAHGGTAGYFAPEIGLLHDMSADGLVAVEGSVVRVPEALRAGVRIVCSVFDAYLPGRNVLHAVAV